MLQVYGVAITLAYTAVVSFIILKVLDVVIGLRVSDEAERDGLDLSAHGETVQ
jgi:ammonium transporter, Amt family